MNKNYAAQFGLLAKILIILAEIRAAAGWLSFGVILVLSDKALCIIHQACEPLRVPLEQAHAGL
jgi:hypothetical protein